MSLTTFIALLRGINVSGHNKIPMAELRSLCTELGWQNVQSYIQSGNLVFQANTTSVSLEAELEQAIEQRFTLSIPVIVRAATDWPTYLKSNPYPTQSQDEPNRVMLALSKASPQLNAADELQKRAVNDEHITQVDDALWIYYGSGAGKSKLSPALFDKLIGSPMTMRNLRTVLKLDELTNHSS
ncbi:MAG: DUF1697 domain-containing protein [Chloroflexota bacterium]